MKEFVLKTEFKASQLILDASENGFNLSAPTSNQDDSLLLFAFTEQRSKEDIDKLVDYLKSYKQ